MPTALVLGAYGFIGAACVRALLDAGYDVRGLGRSKTLTRNAALGVEWIRADMAALSQEEWERHLIGTDLVVNAAGALQTGSRDDLEAVHVTAIERLCSAAPDGLRLIQISAAGAAPDAPTEFFRSKARGDALVRTLATEWVIFRPTLVIGPGAYGGTALLHGIAGFPGVGIRVFDDVPVQTIALNELAEAVVACACLLYTSDAADE